MLLYHTQQGVNVRAIGENPKAADSLGVNVNTLRYRYTILGGMLAGLAGAHLSLSYTPGWTEGLTGGRGWIAIALVVFSTWHPFRAVLGALLFGSINALQFRLQAIGTTVPPAFLGMMPYVLTIVVLVIITRGHVKKRVGAPAALGVPYIRN
jgi:simple sugar transport system permease protein